MKLAIAAVLMLLLSIAVARAAPPAPSDKPVAPAAVAPEAAAAAARTAAYRATANLGWLGVMRTAVEECDLPEDTREEALKLMDDTRQAIVDLVKSESAAAPSEDDAQRQRKMQAVLEPFGAGVRTALGESGVRATTLVLSRIHAEIELLDKEGYLDHMKDLALTDAQLAQIKKTVEAAQAKLKKLDTTGGVPVAEQRADFLIVTRKTVRDTLTNDQRKLWDNHLDEERRKASAGGGKLRSSGTITAKPRPPRPPQNPPK
jgi:hypothetical protein